jgi:peptidoglycan hydrolase-like protein with peptidoglycan-binding domain
MAFCGDDEMTRFLPPGIAAGGIALLAACAQTPLAPTTVVTPGPGKSPTEFQADYAACRVAAAQSVAAQVNAANNSGLAGAALAAAGGDTTGDAAVTGAQTSALAQGGIQQQYDATFGNCMYSRGELVAGMAPPEAAAPPPEPEAQAVVRDPLVMKVQRALVQLGYLHAHADGVAGPKTAAAIRKFEDDKGLTEDGVSSRNLLAALQTAEASAGGAPPAAAPAPDQSGDKFALPPPPPSGSH